MNEIDTEILLMVQANHVKTNFLEELGRYLVKLRGRGIDEDSINEYRARAILRWKNYHSRGAPGRKPPPIDRSVAKQKRGRKPTTG